MGDLTWWQWGGIVAVYLVLAVIGLIARGGGSPDDYNYDPFS